MIIEKYKKGKIMVYHVDKNISDEQMKNLMNTYVNPNQIDFILDHDADVYTKDGQLLLKFRTNVLNNTKMNEFYDNIIDFAKRETSNRGSTSGSNTKNVGQNPKIMTNIFGYFDKLAPKQKMLVRNSGKKVMPVRQCRFNMDYPEKYKKTIPLLKEIDILYKELVPESYNRQRKKANQTHFKIEGTSFTTVTTNINFRTTIHTDKGDDDEGFGNLTVIEKGDYTGGETCLPQYGIGVNVRTGDILFMDVHEPHGNLPIRGKKDQFIRLSVVCYLRRNLWLKTKNKTKKFLIQHNKTIKNLRTKKIK